MSNLDSGRCHLDQPLEEIAENPGTAARMPQSFPDLVRFPVVAMIEQVDAEQIVVIRGPLIDNERKRRGMRLAMTVGYRLW